MHVNNPLSQNTHLSNSTNDASFSIRPSWMPLVDSNLKWACIKGNRPFITNGQSNHPHFETLELESDTTTSKFNLDSLNEDRPEILQDQDWAIGCIPESSTSFIESLVQQVNRGRFRFELGNSSNGPRLLDSQNRNLHNNPL